MSTTAPAPTFSARVNAGVRAEVRAVLVAADGVVAR